VPTQSTGEQSRTNLRRDPIDPPMPRQRGNTGVQPIIARPSSTGAQPIIGRPGGNMDQARADQARVDPASVPTRYAAPVARPPAPANPSPAHEGGHRRAPEPAGRTPDRWTEDSFEQGGRHGSGSYEPVPRPAAAPSTRRAEPEPAGAHAAGRSVTELLAAHSSADEGQRRHRRRAD
jgi:hypothetical protein